MKLLALAACVIMAGAMNAQNVIGGPDDWSVFHGVSIVLKDTPDGPMPVLVNSSDKPLIGYTVKINTTSGPQFRGAVDFGALAENKPLQPNEQRPIPDVTIFNIAGDILSYEVTSTLATDGTFYGPDNVFKEFSSRLSAARSMARDVQYSADKFAVLALHQTPRITSAASVDLKALHHRADMANVLFFMRDRLGDQAVISAIDRLAALPEVKRGE